LLDTSSLCSRLLRRNRGVCKQAGAPL
jgi:hypothetical protein